jgi:hypothetical protein
LSSAGFALGLGFATGPEAVGAALAVAVVVGAVEEAVGAGAAEGASGVVVVAESGFDVAAGTVPGIGRAAGGRTGAADALDGAEAEALGAPPAALSEALGATLAEAAAASLAALDGAADAVAEPVGGGAGATVAAAGSSGAAPSPNSLSRNSTPPKAAAATTPKSTSLPDPVFDGGFGGALEILGRGDGWADPRLPSCAGPRARGDDGIICGGSDTDFACAVPGDIPATIALARAASAVDAGSSAPGGSDAGGGAGSESVSVAETEAEPAKSGLVPMSSIEPPASRRASSSSSAACFMTVCSCFGSGPASGLVLGNIAVLPDGRGGDEVTRGGRDDVEGRGDDCGRAPMPSIVDFPIRFWAARAGAAPVAEGAGASASDS